LDIEVASLSKVWYDISFFLFIYLAARVFGAFFSPFPEEEILDHLTHGPLIQVFTVIEKDGGGRRLSRLGI